MQPRAANAGTVYLVGAGPGDPGLITVRGRALLEGCDAIVYDALANPELVRSAGRDGVPPELHAMGKRGGDSASASQDEINALLIELARRGLAVVRLKGGDPLVFGRGSEEAQALAAARIPFEIVPGVTAGIAASAYAGIPVTHRGVATSVTFVTGHEDPDKEHTQTDWRSLARAGGTIVLYMGVKRLPTIAAELMAGGMAGSTPAAAVQWGTYSRQRTVVATLETLADRAAAEGIAAPVITVIGNAVALREEISWFERRPLFGRRIVVTRARAQASALSERLRSLGADVVETPAIRIERIDSRDVAKLAETVRQGSAYRWMIFTSQNAVDFFWSVLRDAGLDARALAGVLVAAIGPATADALLARGISVDVVPERFVAEGLLEVLGRRSDVRGSRVLYATAEDARDVLPEGLHALGASVDLVPLYRTVHDVAGGAPLRAAIERGEVDLVTLASASAVGGWVTMAGAELVRRVPAASIGPITTAAARAAGIDVVVEAAASTIPGLVDAIVAQAGGSGSR